MRNLILFTLVVIMVAAMLSGCGSSGGPSPGASLTGRVVNGPTGDPLPGVRVALGDKSATTGADGKFTMSNVPLGSGIVTAQLTGFEVASMSVTIVSGTNTLSVDLPMAPVTGDPPSSVPRTVEGTIKLNDGSNGTGVTVTLLVGSDTYDETTTDSNGKYSFWAPAGTYTVRATKAGFTTSDQSVIISDLAKIETCDITISQ